jgi:tetratricopeptide (TPR) repeat protein
MNLSRLFLLFYTILLWPITGQAQIEDTILNQWEFLIELGDSFNGMGSRNEMSRNLYHQAIALEPNNPTPYEKLASLFLNEYQDLEAPRFHWDSAVYYANKARVLDPARIESYLMEVEAYRLKWRHGMGRKVLLEALEHHPKNPEVLTLLGRNYFDTGNPGLALPYLEKAIKTGGDKVPPIAYRFAGWCWFYLEDHQKQLAYFTHFREIDPQSLMGIAGQIHSYTGKKDFGMATALAKQIKKDYPDYPHPAYLEAYIGETLLFGGKHEEALEHYRKSIELDPNAQNLFATRAVNTTLGFLLMQAGREEEGKEYLQKTIDRRKKEWMEMPERWEFSFDLASAYAAMGDLDQAYQWLYTSVLTGYPGHLWHMDPVFQECHDQVAFQQLIKQARIRVESEI